jgi:hypothetical protein
MRASLLDSLSQVGPGTGNSRVAMEDGPWFSGLDLQIRPFGRKRLCLRTALRLEVLPLLRLLSIHDVEQVAGIRRPVWSEFFAVSFRYPPDSYWPVSC